MSDPAKLDLKKTPPAVPPPAAKVEETRAHLIGRLGDQLRRDIIIIGQRLGPLSGLRCLVDRYAGKVSPALAADPDSNLPKSVPVNKQGRCQSDQFGNVLCHYLNEALRQYWGICRQLHRTTSHIERLHIIAAMGPLHFCVAGSEKEGYQLLTPEEFTEYVAAQIKKEKPDADVEVPTETESTEGAAPAGGSGSTDVGKAV